ncbi:LysR family transcriptional regulator [uncultured Sphingomonas sp.]|jgi:LysR family carnitine catabolism transcriptional activator|uniref:LysR family transcriptional regulator n=1 Tax=uncultured Sphingomonas sp. TaxID=158754 RepID=UPI0025E58472|nr:LysR family transcriptional regulator [uncultured Sphingomonas sp.]
MRRTPSLTSLRLFMQVAQHGSFSETGRSANVSQPALSRTIRLLEEQLGVRLFDRNSRNVALTSAGEALLPIVERLTGDFDHAFSELAQNFAGSRGRVVIGALPSVAAGTLPAAIASFRELHPQVEIVLRDHLSGALFQAMEERQLDLAVTTPPDAGKFVFDPLMQDAMVLVVPAGGPLDTGKPARWSIFAEHPFIAMAPRSSVRALTDAAMLQANVAARALYDCTQLATVGALIEAGLGITALPESTLRMLHGGRIAARPLVDPVIERTIGVARLADRTLPPAAQRFLEHFLKVAR